MSFMSVESGQSNNKNSEEDDFVWQDYLETTNTEEVPNILFSHVEQSLKSGFQEGMMLEVPDKSKRHKYWPAVIKMSCGPLLSLCYVSPKRTSEFWWDLSCSKMDMKPLGWCQEQQEQDPSTLVALEPPDALLQDHPDIDWLHFATKSTRGKPSVPAELFTMDGYSAVERIKQGMKVEVQDEQNPLHHWVATIIENVGGRLLLRYNSPDSSNQQNFWLFYTSPRLFRFGWVQKKGSPWQYRAPSSTIESHSEEQWNAVLQTAQLEAEKLVPPPDLFQDGVEIVSHELECGMKLEALHPANKIEVCPATVTRLFETGHFTVHIDSLDEREEGDEQISWLCRPGDPFLFPPGWWQKHELRVTDPPGWTSDLAEFDWEEYLKHTKAIPAPDSFFPKMESAIDMDFAIGQKLEAVNPENQQQICAASISRLVGHLIWVHLDSEESYLPSHVVSTDSTEIFPVGWCGSNNYPLMPPKNYQAHCKTDTSGQVKEPTVSQQESIQKSSWCPKIYFNHKCFTGPFLSKGKLALLPKSVGPGPVTLVLREVLSMLISVAYKSRQVLKELQLEGPLPKHMHLEVLKAKLKSAVYRANVGIVTSSDKVSSYCQDVCAKLQSCPNLFGPELYADNCPVGCSALSKSRFTNYWSKHKARSQQAQACSSLDPALKPKKRGRKKLLTRPKSHSNADDRSKRDKLDDDDMDSEECDTPSRPDSENGDASSKKRMYKKKLFPQFEMRTRGAKLPNFALKMANWTWGKDSYVPAKKQCRVSSDTTNRSSLDLKRRGTRLLSPPSSLSGKRRVVRLNNLRLTSNPLAWSVDDVAHYLRQTPDCGTLAARLAEEDIDGHAFMLLNLPTVQENLHLQLSTAIKLCQHVERVKFAYFSDYCKNKVFNAPS